MAKSKPITYQFKPLEDEMDEDEAEVLLHVVMSDWDKLAKRFDLKGQVDGIEIQKCQFYAAAIINRFPQIKHQYLFYHYDDAMADFLGVKYKIKSDKRSQEDLGYKSLIFEGKIHWLFPIEK